jgi:hypothetical protein
LQGNNETIVVNFGAQKLGLDADDGSSKPYLYTPKPEFVRLAQWVLQHSHSPQCKEECELFDAVEADRLALLFEPVGRGCSIGMLQSHY